MMIIANLLTGGLIGKLSLSKISRKKYTLITMIKIGITGQAGFVGSHLYNFLNLQQNVTLVNFEKLFCVSSRLSKRKEAHY